MATGTENEQLHTTTESTTCLKTAAWQAKLSCERIFQNSLPLPLLYQQVYIKENVEKIFHPVIQPL